MEEARVAEKGLIRQILNDYRLMKTVREIMPIYSQTYLHQSSWLSSEFQRLILENVIRDPFCQKFPPSLPYRQRFLKFYFNEVQLANEEFEEELFEVFNSFNFAKEKEPICYKTFTFHDNIPLTLHITETFHVVGLTAWEAGYFLADTFLLNPNQFQNKDILELGAGVGLTALAHKLLTMRDNKFTAKIKLTDYTHEKKLIENLDEINSDVSTSQIDWLDFDQSQLTSIPDLTIAADVVYDDELIEGLVKVLYSLLSTKKGSTAYIVSSLRNPVTYIKFIKALRQAGLTHDIAYQGSDVHGIIPGEFITHTGCNLNWDWPTGNLVQTFKQALNLQYSRMIFAVVRLSNPN